MLSEFFLLLIGHELCDLEHINVPELFLNFAILPQPYEHNTPDTPSIAIEVLHPSFFPVVPGDTFLHGLFLQHVSCAILDFLLFLSEPQNTHTNISINFPFRLVLIYLFKGKFQIWCVYHSTTRPFLLSSFFITT